MVRSAASTWSSRLRSQTALYLHTNQNTISRYETGEREPGIRELVALADYFHVSVDYLLERTDNPAVNR